MTTVIDQQVAARAIARVSEMPHHAFDAKTFAHMLRVEPAALIDPFFGNRCVQHARMLFPAPPAWGYERDHIAVQRLTRWRAEPGLDG